MGVPTGTPAPHPAVETAFLPPEAVIWDARHHRVHHFNPSASAVWLCLDGQLTVDEIAAELCEIFETPLDVIRPDVDGALAEFVRLGLLDGHDAHDDQRPEAAETEPHGVGTIAGPESTRVDDARDEAGAVEAGEADGSSDARPDARVEVLARPPDP